MSLIVTRSVLDAIPAERALTGVVHTAGVLDDSVMDGLTPQRFEAVYRSKVASALVLDELTRELDLSVFALFSSVAGTVGGPGLGNYASANAVLDALALQRGADGLAATSIAWAAWSGEGMAKDAGVLERSRRGGVGTLDPALAISILGRVVVAAEPTVVVGDLKQPELLASLFSVRPSSLLGDLPGAGRIAEVAAAERQQIASAGSQIRERLRALPEANRVGFLVDLVRTQAASVLGHSSTEQMGADKAFRELGVDSLTAIEIRNLLAGGTGLSLPTSLVFDYPTPRVLAQHLRAELLGEPDEDEDEIRAVLGSLSLAQLRDAGLLAKLLQLTGRATDTSTSGSESGESIKGMDLADLTAAALNGNFDFSSNERS